MSLLFDSRSLARAAAAGRGRRRESIAALVVWRQKMKLTVVGVAMGDWPGDGNFLCPSFRLSWAELILALLYPTLLSHDFHSLAARVTATKATRWLSDHQSAQRHWENHARTSTDIRWIEQTIAPLDPELWLGEGGGVLATRRESGSYEEMSRSLMLWAKHICILLLARANSNCPFRESTFVHIKERKDWVRRQQTIEHCEGRVVLARPIDLNAITGRDRQRDGMGECLVWSNLPQSDDWLLLSFAHHWSVPSHSSLAPDIWTLLINKKEGSKRRERERVRVLLSWNRVAPMADEEWFILIRAIDLWASLAELVSVTFVSE
jgi:hypothetical protein